MNRILQNKWWQGILIGAASGATALVLWVATPVLPGWENITWSWRVKTFAQPGDSTGRIKIILIDQYSLDWASQQMSLPWPWPREVYAPILDFCRRGGARVIAFDMLYSEPSGYMVADDVMFGEAIARSGNFVGAFFLGDQAGQASAWPAGIPRPELTIEHLDDWMPRHSRAGLVETRATFPIPHVAEAAALLANVKDVPDADGVFRRATPFRMFDGAPVPMLSLAAYLAGTRTAPFAMALEKNELRIDDLRVPLDERGRAILRFRGKSGTHEAFTAAAVIESELRMREGGEPLIDPGELRDAFVFFGVSAPGLKDLRPTPVSGDYPGVEMHATFLDNLLAQDFIRAPPQWLVLTTTLLLAVAAAMTVLRAASVLASISWFVFFLVMPFVAGFILYPLGWWWPVMIQALAAMMALVIAEIVNYATEGRQKRFIKSAFKQYLSGEFIEQILRDPSQLKLGGEKRELSIFFSDLQGFSAISEKLGPVGLTALLNDYLTDMSDIIMHEGGTVDKYEGDAIIAFWNAPLSQPDHAVRACRAALLCQRALAARRKEFFDRTGVDLFMRIGIHTGDVVVGNMGSHNRFNYTVLGDAANLASRLEGANKPFGTYLMVSGVTWEQARHAGFHAREIGSIVVVGRQAPVPVYEILGLPDEPAPSMLAEWNRAMIDVRAGRWAPARDMFASMKEDALAQKYVRQCERLLSGELVTWDGIWRLTEK